eukprot:scaffold439_cov415-Prasinococcus_capsulatus_cf.AAC.29
MDHAEIVLQRSMVVRRRAIQLHCQMQRKGGGMQNAGLSKVHRNKAQEHGALRIHAQKTLQDDRPRTNEYLVALGLLPYRRSKC